MSFTLVDISNATLFANARLRLFTLEQLNQKYPHLISHTRYTIRQADYQDDYFYPSRLNNRAIVSDVFITQKLCEKLSCNIAGPKGNCTRTDEAYNYFVGDDGTINVACEPACFNLTTNPTFNDDGVENPHMIRTKFNNNNCVFVPSGYIWAEIPLFRSTEIYETRVNDLPVGFNQTTEPFTASGLSYKYNETYCKAFFDNWDPNQKICYTTWVQQIFNVVIGEQITKLTKAGIHALKNSGNTIPSPDLGTVPPIDEKFKLQNWLLDIDESFQVPDADADNDKIINLHGKQRLSPIIPQKTTNVIESTTDDDINDIILNILNGIIDILIQMFKDPLFVAAIGSDILIDAILSAVKSGSKTVINRIGPILTTFLSRGIGQMPSRIFAITIRTSLTKMLAQVVLKVTSQAIIALAKIAALASSVVGIILIVISLFDLIFVFWDPLGFNNKYPPEMLDELMWNSDVATRQEFQMSIPRVSFELLTLLLLDETELLTINLQSFYWFAEYFDALEINSEGVRINRGNLINITDDVNVEWDHGVVRLVIPTQEEFRIFEQKHSNRWRLTRFMGFVGWGCAIAGGILFAFQMYTAALLIFIICFVVFIISTFNMDFSILVNSLSDDMINRFLRFNF